MNSTCGYRQFLVEFIEMYKSLPTLWKLKSKEYIDRTMKAEAYNRLVRKMREIDPEADREVVTKKINSLRTSYRKERNKVLESIKCGVEPVYVPTLWYFSQLNFLENEDSPLLTVTNLDETSNENFDDFITSSPPPCSLTSRPPSRADSPVTSHPLVNPKRTATLEGRNETCARKRFCHRRVQSNRASYAEQDPEHYQNGTTLYQSSSDGVHQKHTGDHIERYEDQHDAFGRSVAWKLRRLPNIQRIFLEKLINDAVFEAELGNLSRYCRVVCPPRETKSGEEVVVKDEPQDVYESSHLDSYESTTMK